MKANRLCYIDIEEMLSEVRYSIEKEKEMLEEKAEQVKSMQSLVEVMDDLIEQNARSSEELERLREELERSRAEVENLQRQLADTRRQKAYADMKLDEMGKLSASVASKTDEEAMLKALRKYVNRSKRKTPDKRTFAKMATLEIANANGLVIPADLKETIESLDDEQAEPKVVTVHGNYHDMHGNGRINVMYK